MTMTSNPVRRRAFTLIELMFALTIGLVVAGSAVLLMFQSAQEQRRGLAAASVEENAYLLQSRISGVLRTSSSSLGLQPDYGTTVYDSTGTNVLGYGSVLVFTPTNGTYVTGRINYTPASGTVIYIPNVTGTAQTLWMTNSQTCRLTNLLFSLSANLDGSPNSSLVNVNFLMDDNGFNRFSTNNPANIFRSFSIQMRND